jgi:UDPglucose 6-dehydrogenase
MERAATELPGIQLCRCADEVAEGVDALLVATEWPEFKKLDWQMLRERMSRPLILDCRNLLDADKMISIGYEYYCVGRPERDPEAGTSFGEAASRR